jgi:hypothetical protein
VTSESLNPIEVGSVSHVQPLVDSPSWPHARPKSWPYPIHGWFQPRWKRFSDWLAEIAGEKGARLRARRKARRLGIINRRSGDQHKITEGLIASERSDDDACGRHEEPEDSKDTK